MTDQPEAESDRVDCTDCFALPASDNTRIAYLKAGGRISETETWHTPDCPALSIMEINLVEGSKRIQEQEEWARGVFPAAHDRLKKAAAELPVDIAAHPFADALTELV
ncbi:hypothetical protein AB0B79_06205 [Streptomyces sp. NPDC039022]|uniref:hypothetical protein n=1 Tax=Streptomyces sp. NPDC039022 TaxID=3157091 RepID=UPI003409F579